MINFTFEGLKAAQMARKKLKQIVGEMQKTDSDKGEEKNQLLVHQYRDKFERAISNDLNLPQALAIVWDTLGDAKVSGANKREFIKAADRVLGLKLLEPSIEEKIPADILELVQKRTVLRHSQDFVGADAIRDELLERGYVVEDGPKEPIIKRK
jgi:cysteinyl-tRNA synthetase